MPHNVVMHSTTDVSLCHEEQPSCITVLIVVVILVCLLTPIGQTAGMSNRPLPSGFGPIRIQYFSTDLVDTNVTLEMKTGVKDNFIQVTKRLSELINVNRVDRPLLLPRHLTKACTLVHSNGTHPERCMVLDKSYSGEYCNGLPNWKIPEDHLEGLLVYDSSTADGSIAFKNGTGSENTDLIVYISMTEDHPNCKNRQAEISSSNICYNTSSRPKSGWINVCPSLLTPVSISSGHLSLSLLQQIIYILGFNLNPLLNQGWIESSRVSQFSRSHFNCDKGIPIQVSDTTNNLIWDPIFMHTSLMSSSPLRSPYSVYIDPATLALLEDLPGWYHVNFTSADNFLWGAQGGCTFHESCLDRRYFCQESEKTSCHYTRRFSGSCSAISSRKPDCRVVSSAPESAVDCGTDKRCLDNVECLQVGCNVLLEAPNDSMCSSTNMTYVTTETGGLHLCPNTRLLACSQQTSFLDAFFLKRTTLSMYIETVPQTTTETSTDPKERFTTSTLVEITTSDKASTTKRLDGNQGPITEALFRTSTVKIPNKDTTTLSQTSATPWKPVAASYLNIRYASLDLKEIQFSKQEARVIKSVAIVMSKAISVKESFIHITLRSGSVIAASVVNDSYTESKILFSRLHTAFAANFLTIQVDGVSHPATQVAEGKDPFKSKSNTPGTLEIVVGSVIGGIFLITLVVLIVLGVLKHKLKSKRLVDPHRSQSLASDVSSNAQQLQRTVNPTSRLSGASSRVMSVKHAAPPQLPDFILDHGVAPVFTNDSRAHSSARATSVASSGAQIDAINFSVMDQF